MITADHSLTIFCNGCQREIPPDVGHDCTVQRYELEAVRADLREIAQYLEAMTEYFVGIAVTRRLPYEQIRKSGDVMRRIAQGRVS